MKARVVGDTDVIVVNWGNDVQRLLLISQLLRSTSRRVREDILVAT